jgi:flavodoxin
MKGVVVYDTHYGNTKAVAGAIAAQPKAEGHEAELRSVRENHPGPPQEDILFLESPIRMGSVTRRVRKLAGKLDKEAWKGKPIVVLTTTLAQPSHPQPSAPMC